MLPNGDQVIGDAAIQRGRWLLEEIAPEHLPIPKFDREIRSGRADAAASAPERHDCKLDAGTHLMHLETGRRALYDAVGRALKGDQP